MIHRYVRNKHLFVLIHIRERGEFGTIKQVKALQLQCGASFVDNFLIYVSCLSCFLVCSLYPCGHLLGKGYLLALLYVMFSCVFDTFPCGVLGQVYFLSLRISALLKQWLYVKFRLLDSLMVQHIML